MNVMYCILFECTINMLLNISFYFFKILMGTRENLWILKNYAGTRITDT